MKIAAIDAGEAIVLDNGLVAQRAGTTALRGYLDAHPEGAKAEKRARRCRHRNGRSQAAGGHRGVDCCGTGRHQGSPASIPDAYPSGAKAAAARETPSLDAAGTRQRAVDSEAWAGRARAGSKTALQGYLDAFRRAPTRRCARRSPPSRPRKPAARQQRSSGIQQIAPAQDARASISTPSRWRGRRTGARRLAAIETAEARQRADSG